MASIGHLALAYLMSVGLNLKLRDTGWLAIFSVLPDVSFIPLLIGIDVHRQFTHSLLLLVVIIAIYVFTSNKLAALAFLGFGSHVLIDMFDTYGVQLFFPFGDKIALGLWPADPVSLTDLSVYFSSQTYVADKVLVIAALFVFLCELARVRRKKRER